MSSKKRKVCDDVRMFNVKWELGHLICNNAIRNKIYSDIIPIFTSRRYSEGKK